MKKIILSVLLILTVVFTATSVFAYSAVQVDDTFAGNKIAFIGDSISNNYNISAENQYTKLVVDALGFSQHQILASNGSRISDAESNSFIKRYPSLDNNANFVVVFGGVNDYMANVPLGAVDSQDPLTFNGALNVLYAGLVAKYPSAQIWVLTPPQSETILGLSDEANSAGLTLSDYVDAMLARRIFGINVLDLYNLSNINVETSLDDRNTFYYAQDGVHPNEIGHKRIADMLISVIGGKDLFTDANKTEDTYISGTGVVVPGNPGTHVTDYIEVEPGYTYMLVGMEIYPTKTYGRLYNYYDADKTWLNLGASSTQINNIITVPEGVKYVRMNWMEANPRQHIRLIKNFFQVDFVTDTDPINSIHVFEPANTIVPPTNPTKTGFIFSGWYKDTNFVNKWNFDSDVVSDDVLLHAKWLPASTGGGAPVSGDDVTTSPLLIALIIGGTALVGYLFFTDKGRKSIGLK